LNPEDLEILTRHSLIQDNFTYVSNTSFVETKIMKEILGMQLAVDGLKGTKWVTVGWERGNVLVQL